MDKIYKVFVSSTYEDLRPERAAIQEILLKLKCLPVGMELFPATNEGALEFIKNQIIDSDYYVVVVGAKYGSETEVGISFTETEYEYATEAGKPILAFVKDGIDLLPANLVEIDAVRREKIQKFRTKLMGIRLVRKFNTPHELASELAISFVDLRERHPTVGYIRADQAKTAAEYLLLLEENQRLREKLTSLENIRQPVGLDSLPDVRTQLLVSKQYSQEHVTLDEYAHGGVHNVSDFCVVEANLRELFLLVGELLLQGYDNEDQINPQLAEMLTRRKMKDTVAKIPAEFNTAKVFFLSNDSMGKIRSLLQQDGVLSADLIQYQEPDFRGMMMPKSYRSWVLTSKGLEIFNKERVISKH